MKNVNKEKITFICFLFASLCFFISGIASLIRKENGVWVTNLCLGSCFLCLSTTYLNKSKGKNKKDKK